MKSLYIPKYKLGGKVDLTPETIKKYIESLKTLENSQKKGFINNKWYPHKSLEGGRDTISYGHKITGKEGIDFYKGITETQAINLLEEDIIKHQNVAKEYIDAIYGKGNFNNLSQDSQMLLTDYAFNGVLNKFVKFNEGVVENNKELMRKEYTRYYNGSNPLKERNNWTRSIIDNMPDNSDNKSSKYTLPYDILPNYISSTPLDNLKVVKQNQYLFKLGGVFKDPRKPYHPINNPDGYYKPIVIDPSNPDNMAKYQAYQDSLYYANTNEPARPGEITYTADEVHEGTPVWKTIWQENFQPINYIANRWKSTNVYRPVFKYPRQPYEIKNNTPPPPPPPTREKINISSIPVKDNTTYSPPPLDPTKFKRPVIKSTSPDKNLYIQFKDPNQSTRTGQEIIHFGDWDTYKEFNDALQNSGRLFNSFGMNMSKTKASSSYGGTTKEKAMEIYKKYTEPKSTYRTGGLFKDPPVNPTPSLVPSGVNVFATSNSIYRTPNNTTANKPVEYNPVYKSLAEKNFTKQELNAINNKKPDVLKQDKSAPKPVKLTPFEQKVLEKEIEAQTLGQSKVTTNQFGEPVIKWDPTQPKASGRIEPEYMDPITMAATFGAGAYGLGYSLPTSLGIAADNALFNLPSLGKGIGKLALKNVPKPTFISSSVENITLPKITSEQRKDMSGYLKRRQFLKNLQKEGLVGKEFNLGDVNYAARSTDKTNKLTQFALNRQATRFRGVAGSVPKNGKGTEYYSGSTFDMSKPAWNNQISEFENMKNAGVDFDDPLSIAKYQASHVPMQQYNYTSGLPRNENLGGLYASFEPNDYGNYIIRMTSPRDYSVGNYQDWYNKYFDPKNNFDDLSVGLERYTFNPVLSYDKPMAMYRGSANVMGKRGSKMFDVDEAFPFMDKKNLSEEQLLELKNFVKNLSQDYETGWRGKYQQGGTMSKGGLFKKKGGQMIKRADGSYSQRGLWDNIRANKGSGKKPTKQMLEQERKIKNK
jgi:hypothetical protein